MKIAKSLSEVEKAVISFPGHRKGRGILIPGLMILTAAHCIQYRYTKLTNLNDVHPVKVVINDHEIYLNLLFVDPISDIAVLGVEADLGGESFNVFLDFCNKTEPVKIIRKHQFSTTVEPIKILNNNWKWIDGTCEIPSSPYRYLYNLKFEKRIVPGASGGPIIDNNGRLVSIVSSSHKSASESFANAPIPWLTLPKWIIQTIDDF